MVVKIETVQDAALHNTGVNVSYKQYTLQKYLKADTSNGISLTTTKVKIISLL